MLRPAAKPQARITVLFLVVISTTAWSQDAPRSVPSVTAKDHPNDAGTAIDVSWELSPDDGPDVSPALLTDYSIFRSRADGSDLVLIGTAAAGETSFDDQEATRGVSYRYVVIPSGPGGAVKSDVFSAPVTPVMQRFRQDRGWLAVIIATVCGAVITFILIAKSGRELYVRRIPGLEAVDEAVGRATEMGQSCLFIPGIQDINDIQTVAGMTVLSHVATLTAEYGARLEVPTCRSLVMTTARETVASSYLAAGRPDAYREDDVYYVTDEQFGYVASVTATMTKEKPAACFYMGSFFAESLILAETGNAIGAIQVAGTAQPSQLPFFVAACDYTLIGEEFFAASAYLSGEPVQLGSLRGQDVGKIIAGVLIVIGCALATWAGPDNSLLAYVTNNILGSGGFVP